MSDISNDSELRQAIDKLDASHERAIAAMFVKSVLSLSDDGRVSRAVDVAADLEATDDALNSAFKDAKSAAIDSHTRCGADADWTEQASYFVARAATAAVAPSGQVKSESRAWQAAMSSRMARTCQTIEAGDDAEQQEREAQYRMLSDFLNNQ
ncbi:hypothetical protein BOW53_07465 [Solemya pervernicosa gill symbiont]|uniref:Uncharacterized protein n=1 Tax=Solemya pervernicosa gill symbiont TaxID=642797 RepID=A0A1T2L5W1_9GAMM|nr:hypothetical protein [Solemya pervernicosa gill symbiont]OOZ40479.1 hypothetical protein BOW53_07465 [Solemya pervernicosa gill symbiont]